MNPIMNGSQSAWEMNIAEEKSLGEEQEFYENPAGGNFSVNLLRESDISEIASSGGFW